MIIDIKACVDKTVIRFLEKFAILMSLIAIWMNTVKCVAIVSNLVNFDK